jgi:hypothetical protein
MPIELLFNDSQKQPFALGTSWIGSYLYIALNKAWKSMSVCAKKQTNNVA